ncbi:MAG TPA: type II toxin-antitoxin system VapC family toxin [Gammaproteobacteria bacterium]
MILPDANLLIYAIEQDAPQHPRARAWFEDILSSNTLVGLPWIVIVAFIRITTNRKAMVNPLKAEEALAYMDSWLQQPFVKPLNPGERHWLILNKLLHDNGTAGNLTNDAHIAAIAIEHGYIVYSADNDFKRFTGLQHINPLEHNDIHETLATYR